MVTEALEEAKEREAGLIRELIAKQKLIHHELMNHGQFHQWNPFENCRDVECVRIRALGEEGGTL